MGSNINYLEKANIGITEYLTFALKNRMIDEQLYNTCHKQYLFKLEKMV